MVGLFRLRTRRIEAKELLMSTVVIVGAGSGLGLSVAQAFGAKGFDVALVARNKDHLDDMNSALANSNITSRGFVADVTDESQIAAAFAQVREVFGQVDVLVYNAGVIAAVSAAEATAELTNKHLQVNIIGAIASAQQVIPDMVERGQGAIFFTGGGSSELTATPMLTTLSIGKSGLRSYARCLHEDLKDKGVYAGMVSTSGVIEPGTAFDPDVIAREYVDMFDKRDTVERFFTGRPAEATRPAD